MKFINSFLYKLCVLRKKFDTRNKKTYRPQSRWGYITPTYVACTYCSYRYGLHTKYLKYENTDQEWIFILPSKKEHKYLVCGVCCRSIF